MKEANQTSPKAPGLSLSQAGAYLGIHVNTLRRWINSGRLDAPKGLNGQYQIPLSELDRVRADVEAGKLAR